MINKLIPLILLMNFLSSTLIISQVNFYPREGENKSQYNDGPYVYYQNSIAVEINTVEDNRAMILSVVEKNYNNLNSIEVYKRGFMPRKFSVKLRKNFSAEPFEFKNVDSLFVLSDYEGNFNSFVNILQQHNILDYDLNWEFGKGHLVIIGDIFDRGVHQTELLWLIYKIEEEAKRRGGFVHFLLGNHEVMNMKGDLRYLEQKYNVVDSLVSAELNLRYVDLIGTNSELGKWLRSKNTIVKIDDKIFVHAGISPKLLQARLSIGEINELIRRGIDKDTKEYNFIDSLLFKRNGPLWYRGYFNEDGYETASAGDVKLILENYEAGFIFVGHTRFDKPEKFFEGNIRAINVDPIQDHQFEIPARRCYGIFIKGDKFYIADENGYLEKY